MDGFDSAGAHFNTVTIGGEGPPVFVWAHGWGQDHQAMLEVARALEARGRHVLLDFPGFGGSPAPPGAWGTAEYADAVAEWLVGEKAPKFWVGHSFGCRVGLQVAARHHGLLDGMVLIAPAGLRRQRGVAEKARLGARVMAYKALRRLEGAGLDVDRLKDRLGSSDYRAAGAMRPVLVKVINEDLTDVAAGVTCPTLLLCGREDTETPLEISERFQRLIPGATLAVLDGFDHYTVLTTGRHQVAFRISRFVEGLTA